MEILIATDDRFVDKYLVTLISLFESNKKNNICIHLIRDELLSNDGFEKIVNLVSEYSQKIKVWDLDKDSKKCLEGINFSKWGTPTIYRLLALSILDGIDRFLWIDGDVLVQKDINEFYSQPFDDNYIVACQDIAFTKAYREGIINHISGLKNDVYFNAGISLYNLKKIREDGIIENMWEWTRVHAKNLIYPDQDIMNVVFNGKIKQDNPMHNNCQVGSIHWTKENEILDDASIIHFVGTKPWDKNYRKKLSSAIDGSLWWSYATKLEVWQKEYVKWKKHQMLFISPWNEAYKIYWKILKRKKQNIDS